MTGLALAAPEPGRRWGDLRKRVVSAAVLGPIALAAIWRGETAFFVLIALAGIGLAAEWVHLCGLRVLSVAGALTVLAVAMACGLAVDWLWRAALICLAVGAVVVALVPGTVPRWFWAGVPYVGVGLIALLWLRHHPFGRFDVLYLVLVVWAADIGAYAAGRVIGGPKLAPVISPSKTWAGALGGLVAALLVGWLVFWVVLGEVSPGRVTAVTLALAISAEAGDLLESAIKRRLGVKDSGRLIPGHGGLLDRLDGLMAAGPVMVVLMLMFGFG